MPGHNDRKYREEVYIERRHSESPSRYASAPYVPSQLNSTSTRPAAPAFNPVAWEPERGRSTSSRSSSRRSTNREQIIAYDDDQIRAHSLDGRRRSSSRHPSTSSRGSYAMPATPPQYPEEYVRHRNSSRSSSVISHPVQEDPEFTATDEADRAKKVRNKQLLYGGLAAITTIAATNNIYQSSKGHKERRLAVRNGDMTESEARSAKKKSIVMDLVSVGVGAICVNNAVNGWKKSKSLNADEEIRKHQWDHHVREERRKSMVGY